MPPSARASGLAAIAVAAFVGCGDARSPSASGADEAGGEVVGGTDAAAAEEADPGEASRPEGPVGTRRGGLCDPELQAYPVDGPHNGGWDESVATQTCPPHDLDNSDYSSGHKGNDIFADQGTPVVAPVDGTIYDHGWNDVGGNFVTVVDGCGWHHYHAHLHTLASDLWNGKEVQAGAELGTVGQTGNAQGTAPHVHYSVYPGTYDEGIDPFELLEAVDHTACGGGQPDVDIEVETHPPEGQPADFRPEGGSEGILDLYEGQTFSAEVLVTNAAGAGTTDDGVVVGVWFEEPWLDATGYTIYTDWPENDQQSWSVNDSNDAPGNPSHGDPPKKGDYQLYAMSPGETKRIVFEVRANQYSVGKIHHPDVRAWVWHVGNWYGEQAGWDDAVEVNLAGEILRDHEQHDVYGLDRWHFEAGYASETEGWQAAGGTAGIQVDPDAGVLTIDMAGGDPQVVGPKAAIDADAMQALRLRVDADGGAPYASQVFFRREGDDWFAAERSAWFVTPSEGGTTTAEVNLADHPHWSGTVTQLRFDPAIESNGTYRVDGIEAVASGSTTGDADGDDHLRPPAGEDCDDGDGQVHPGADERCNGTDDDCDGNADEGFGLGGGCSVGTGACENAGQIVCDGPHATTCSAAPHGPNEESCNDVDDDCDGKTDEDFDLGQSCAVGKGQCKQNGQIVCSGGNATCSASPGQPGNEACNDADDDCDGLTDEDFDLGKDCSVGKGTCQQTGQIVCGGDGQPTCSASPGSPDDEACNDADDDCDGLTDEIFDLGSSCSVGQGGCESSGQIVCGPDGQASCSASPGSPADEACNGLDDDCDGQTDEGEVCEPPDPACEPGETSACPLAEPIGDCTEGIRPCQEDGTWGPCSAPSDCGSDVAGSDAEAADVAAPDTGAAGDADAAARAEPAPDAQAGSAPDVEDAPEVDADGGSSAPDGGAGPEDGTGAADGGTDAGDGDAEAPPTPADGADAADEGADPDVGAPPDGGASAPDDREAEDGGSGAGPEPIYPETAAEAPSGESASGGCRGGRPPRAPGTMALLSGMLAAWLLRRRRRPDLR